MFGHNSKVDLELNREVEKLIKTGGKEKIMPIVQAGEPVLRQQTIAYDEGTEVGTAATQTLNELVSTALSEAQIESLVIAKGYADCVTYIHDDTVCVAVAAPAEGLDQTDVALISDVVTAQTDYPLSQVRIIEVKG